MYWLRRAISAILGMWIAFFVASLVFNVHVQTDWLSVIIATIGAAFGLRYIKV